MRSSLGAVRAWFTRLWNTLRPSRADRDLEDELRLHLDLEVERLQRTGYTPEAARRAAVGRVGALGSSVEAVRDRRGLASANAGLALAKIEAERHSAQLQATLAGMSDGVSLVDGSLRLVAWNPRFPDLAGVHARLLRVGLPMEEMLRLQAEAGQFGPVDPVA